VQRQAGLEQRPAKRGVFDGASLGKGGMRAGGEAMQRGVERVTREPSSAEGESLLAPKRGERRRVASAWLAKAHRASSRKACRKVCRRVRRQGRDAGPEGAGVVTL
jgi:hypothetical protein